jgi:nicotinamide-nucleotide amidase
MSVAILCIGTELVRGEIVNTNASWLGEELTRLGFEVREHAVIADDIDEITTTLTRLARSSKLIIVTGGLGPTTDDITSLSVARLLGVPLERDPGSLEAIRARLAKSGRSLNESNKKQADFPRGASVLPNLEGTAPGFAVDIDAARAFFLPGVPGEMKPMLLRTVLPQIQSVQRGGMAQLRLHTFGLPEATVNELLAGVEERHGVILGYRAHFPEIEIKVLAKRDAQPEADRIAEIASAEVRQRLGKSIFAEGDVTVAESVGNLLRARRMTLGLAESCTGGRIAGLVTDRAASDYFVGGIVCYDNRIKRELLGVDAQTLERHGAVSPEVAEQMAVGARRVLGVDFALSVTGIAGPSGGSAEKPVGLVYFAVASKDGVTLDSIRFPRSREQIRVYSAFKALILLGQVILEGHSPS